MVQGWGSPMHIQHLVWLFQTLEDLRAVFVLNLSISGGRVALMGLHFNLNCRVCARHNSRLIFPSTAFVMES